MILVDSSVWADHFNQTDDQLQALLENRSVAMHHFIIGEVAIGNLRRWDLRVAQMSALPDVGRVSDEEWLSFVREHELCGTGIGFVDAHLLAAVAAVPGVKLWSRDKRLASQAANLSLAWAFT